MCCLIYKFLLILTQKMQISFLKILPENALKFVSKKMRICVKNFAQLQSGYRKLDRNTGNRNLNRDRNNLITTHIKSNSTVLPEKEKDFCKISGKHFLNVM